MRFGNRYAQPTLLLLVVGRLQHHPHSIVRADGGSLGTMAPEMSSSGTCCYVVEGDSYFGAGDKRGPTTTKTTQQTTAAATTAAVSSGEQELRAELAARRRNIGILRHPIVTLR